jgi:hypothetical protein
MRKPLIWENWRSVNDYKNEYNPAKYSTSPAFYSQIDPENPTGLEPAPKDPQYEKITQMRKPLVIENWREVNDYKNTYNPGKSQHVIGQYSQKPDPEIIVDPKAVSPFGRGLEPAPIDPQYGVKHP